MAALAYRFSVLFCTFSTNSAMFMFGDSFTDTDTRVICFVPPFPAVNDI